MTNGAYGTYQMLPTSQHLVDIKAQLEQVTFLVSLCDYKTMSIPFCIGLFVTNEKIGLLVLAQLVIPQE